MKKKTILLQLSMFLLAINTAAADSVIISQVLYDPEKESGGEAVELFNPASNPTDISGWVLATETSPTDVTIPADTFIGGRSYYLIADTGWSSAKEEAWMLADYEETMTLTNIDAGIALRNGSQTIDAAGWGTAANIEAGLYEGYPHPGSEEGEALARIKDGNKFRDTNNNMIDFETALPGFRNSSYGAAAYSGSKITVTAIVGGSAPSVNSLSIITDDDKSSPGVQINPVPKQNKTVQVESIISHSNGNDYVSSATLAFNGISTQMSKVQEYNSTSSLYAASFNISPYQPAGKYAVKMIAADKSGITANASASFDYTELIALEIDAANLQFAAMPGMTSEIAGDYDSSTNTNVTVQNVGNSVTDIELSATNLTNSHGTIDAGSIQYTFNGDYNNDFAGALSQAKQLSKLGMHASAVLPLSFKLSVPTATAPGNYTGTISLIAVKG
ncbi:lamin tail domain-containing protein [Candidatus Woesearchaeota archaeon]|nr:lamin tail domain-containing protein [Candidatus Woesearchaeota archaeon]